MVSTRSSHYDESDDPTFSTLPLSQRRRIDDAFAASATTRKNKGHEDDMAMVGSGIDIDEPGGFLIEESEPECSAAVLEEPFIPLSCIPGALALLDLEADDDTLAVFSNAATGWGAQTTGDGGVGRKDWRAVCTVLLDSQGDQPEEENSENFEDSGSEGEAYQMSLSSLSSEGDGSLDEYKDSQLGVKTKSAAGNSRKLPPRIAGRVSSSAQLTEEEKVRCRADFARFFPGIAHVDLDRQYLTVNELINAAQLLNERLRPEEVSFVPASDACHAHALLP